VRAHVVSIVGVGDEAPTTGQIPFTPRAKKVLELSLREALSLGHNNIGTEHVLLGLAREDEGIAMQIARDLGADAETIRNAVIGAFGGVPPRAFARIPSRRRGRSPLLLVVTTWTLGAVTLGAGILIGWAIWG
jgi:Clp amino terminal domain, pathogenicity island component